MKRLEAFGRFWWDFVIGDDWLVAVLVVDRASAPPPCSRHAGVTAWWLHAGRRSLLILWLSLRRAIRSALTGGPVAQLVRAADS